jgi:hypothetical protein
VCFYGKSTSYELAEVRRTSPTGGVAGSSVVKAVRDPDRLGCAVQGCVQIYKKASVNVFPVRSADSRVKAAVSIMRNRYNVQYPVNPHWRFPFTMTWWQDQTVRQSDEIRN